MDNTKLAEELCAVIDHMNVIIQAQAMELLPSSEALVQ